MAKKKGRDRTPAPIARVAVSALVVLAALAAAELLLRLGGVAYKAWRIGGPEAMKGSQVILCVGDSYTFGVGARKGDSYPDRLQQLLDADCGPGRYLVVNDGRPGQNSSKMLERLPGLMELHKPKALVILAGVNNITLLGSNFSLFYPGSSNKLSRWLINLDLRARDLRVYRLLRNAFERKAAEEPGQYFPKPCLQTTESLIGEAASRYNTGRFQEAVKAAREAAARESSCAQAHSVLAYFLYKTGDYREAFDSARTAQKLAPDDPQLKWLLSKEIPLTRPDSEVQPVLGALLKYDLTRMAMLAREYGAGLIVQNYPGKDNMRDTVRKEVADLYGALYADNDAAFRTRFAGLPPRAYRSFDEPDGGHPNAAGYALMAENVYSRLAGSGISCRK